GDGHSTTDAKIRVLTVDLNVLDVNVFRKTGADLDVNVLALRQPVRVVAAIKNHGDADANDANIEFFWDRVHDENRFYTTTIDLRAGGSTTVTATWDTNVVWPGDHNVLVWVDRLNDYNETIESNNDRNHYITISENNCNPPLTGSWVIENKTRVVCKSKEVDVNGGNLVLKDVAEAVFRDSNLDFNLATDYEYFLQLQDNAGIDLNDSNIKSDGKLLQAIFNDSNSRILGEFVLDNNTHVTAIDANFDVNQNNRNNEARMILRGYQVEITRVRFTSSYDVNLVFDKNVRATITDSNLPLRVTMKGSKPNKSELLVLDSNVFQLSFEGFSDFNIGTLTTHVNVDRNIFVSADANVRYNAYSAFNDVNARVEAWAAGGWIRRFYPTRVSDSRTGSFIVDANVCIAKRIPDNNNCALTSVNNNDQALPFADFNYTNFGDANFLVTAKARTGEKADDLNIGFTTDTPLTRRVTLSSTPPVAICTDQVVKKTLSAIDVNLNANQSLDSNGGKDNNTTYVWDKESDGTVDVPSTGADSNLVQYSCASSACEFLATLTVTDNNTTLTDQAQCKVSILGGTATIETGAVPAPGFDDATALASMALALAYSILARKKKKRGLAKKQFNS
ncbi:MAG TPA: CARDB domain-containing protein, partial [archaeon]|nr:CARDB domain-containing protein [archaeon]